ncbi:MAG: hypothetical protein ACE5FH_03630 [Candidatus Zixiibacteriota bacterium]
MKWRLAAMYLIVSGFLTTGSQAQFTQDPNDGMAADTVDLAFPLIPDAATGQLNLEMEVYLFNDSNSITGVTMGFDWDNPNLQMDSAVASPDASAAFDLGVFFFEAGDIAITNANQRFLFGGAKLFTSGLTPSPTRRRMATYYFTLSNWNAADSIVIDTLRFNQGSIFKLVSTGNIPYIPYWTGQKKIRDTSFVPSANLIVNPDTLHFEAVEGQGSPSAQTFVVSSDGDPLAFTLSEDAPWIVVSPTQGTTVQTINVLPNSTGLTTGDYIDTISVVSGAAANSPQTVVVTMHVEPPPPVIVVSPAQLFFNAVAGGSNPTPKTLTITNGGGQVLNWDLSNSELWLSLSPSAGSDSGDVSLSVDISSLAFGEYDDTVVVSDPAAENDPVLVPVHLSIGSDLPVIEVAEAYNFVLVVVPIVGVPPRNFTITNSGAGTMTFSLQESTPRILTLTPVSGTAPQTITVDFKPQGGVAGEEYFDTVWVSSNEAINSPFPVVFDFLYTDDPGQLELNFDTLDLNVFECDQGAFGIMPARSFIISNVGGEDPLSYSLEYESTLFTINKDSGTVPDAVTVTALDLGLPLGSYLDTVLIHAHKAFNSPDTLIVKYNMIQGIQAPEIFLGKTHFDIPAQENGGPIPPSATSVLNRFGGCMPWEVQESVPWLSISPPSGDVPGAIGLATNSSGYLFGEYPDSFLVIAPDATNSPLQVTVNLQIWRFHGDWDYSGEINILDLVRNVDWLFSIGLSPQPTLFVGDLNCDHWVNIEDLTYFVDYLFGGGPIPCGNPY